MRSDVSQFSPKVHGMAMYDFGSSTKNSDRFHWLARYLRPVWLTPCNFSSYLKAHWMMLLGETRNISLQQKAQFNLHY
jgi:hypothetical protein